MEQQAAHTHDPLPEGSRTNMDPSFEPGRGTVARWAETRGLLAPKTFGGCGSLWRRATT
jgi:hypothetical protein